MHHAIRFTWWNETRTRRNSRPTKNSNCRSICYLPIGAHFGVVAKVVKISVLRFPGKSSGAENSRRSIQSITESLQNLKRIILKCK